MKIQHKLVIAVLILAALLFGATGGNIQWTQLVSGARHGTGTKGQSSDGTGTSGNCVRYDANGNVTDAGAACGVGSSPLTTKGDVYTYGSANARLAVGSNTQVLTANSAAANGVDWEAAGGFSNPMTTKGDVILGGASGTPQRLAVGSNTQCLTANSAATYGVDWEACGAGTTVTVANGTSALGTGAISSGACASTVSTAATGVATTDNIQADFNADPTGTTGYAPSTSGMLTIIKFPTSGHVNFDVCNNTGASITPGAVTLNWRVVR
jgi:hypothetical protein